MAIPVFIAYARVDEAFRKELVKHLGLLEKQGLISVWHDGLIAPSAKWEAELERHLLEARLIVFLVSADFFHSDYCHDKEMKRALDRHDRGEARVVPVLIRDCLWQDSPLAKIQLLPADAKPVDEWPKPDAAWVNVASGIKAEVLKLREADARAERERLARERVEQEAQRREQERAARAVAEQRERARQAEEKAAASRLVPATNPPPRDKFAWRKARWPALFAVAGVAVLVLIKAWPKPSTAQDSTTDGTAQPSAPLSAPSAELADAGAPDAQAPQPVVPKALDAPPPALADIAPMAFKKLPTGYFVMGSPEGEANRNPDEKPHPAEVAAFEIATHEVTQKQWKSVMGNRNFNCTWGCQNQIPAHSVSWYDTLTFMNKLTETENKKLTDGSKRTICYFQQNGEWAWNQACTGYRLPTETEWEYAARAGTTTAYSFGDDPKNLCAFSNGGDAAAKRRHSDWTWLTTTTCEDDKYPELAPVGSFQPNPWGLYDMHGNVWEWVWDLYAEYPSSSKPGHAGPDKTTDGFRVLRGGSFYYEPRKLRSANRDRNEPSNTIRFYGFRCVRNAPQPHPK